MKKLLLILLLLPVFVSGQTNLYNNFKVQVPKNIDSRTGKWNGAAWIPFATVQEANDSIRPEYRYPFLTVMVGTSTVASEYWYNGGTTNAHLMLKIVQGGGGSSYTFNYGLINNANAVSADTTIGEKKLATQGFVSRLLGAYVPAPLWSNIGSKPPSFPPSAHTHLLSDLQQSGATTGQVPRWNGSAWEPATQSGGGGPSYAPKVYNVKEYGAIGDGVNTPERRTTNTAAFIAAIQAVQAAGTGCVLVPHGHFFVNPIHLPGIPGIISLDGIGYRTVEIRGEDVPNLYYGTVGDFSLPIGGCIVECPSTTPGQAVFVQDAYNGDFSGCHLRIANLDVRTYNNPVISGIHAGWAAQFSAENVQVTNGLYSVASSLPTTATSAGIITPYHNNGANIVLRNVAVSGFYTGVVAHEHTFADYMNLTCCLRGLELAFGAHSSHFDRLTVQRSQVGIYVSGANRFTVSNFNIEHAGEDQTNSNNEWQLTDYDIVDPSHLGVGELRYAVTLGNSGPDNASFSRNGGNNIIAIPIGQGAAIPPNLPNKVMGGAPIATSSTGLGFTDEAFLEVNSGTVSNGTSGMAQLRLVTNQPNGGSFVGYVPVLNPALSGSDKRAGGILCLTGASNQYTEWYFNILNGGTLEQAFSVKAGLATFAGRIKATIPTYANDAAADADAGLVSGSLYKITGSRAVYQKP